MILRIPPFPLVGLAKGHQAPLPPPQGSEVPALSCSNQQVGGDRQRAAQHRSSIFRGVLAPPWAKTVTAALSSVWQFADYHNHCIWAWDRNNIGCYVFALDSRIKSTALTSWCHAQECGLLKKKKKKLKIMTSSSDEMKAVKYMLFMHICFNSSLFLGGGFFFFFPDQLLKYISRWALQNCCRQSEIHEF